jgi:D-mannonate dehydratase
MKLGCQAGPLTDERLEFLRRHSVEAVCGSPAAPRDGRMWEADELAQFRERVEKHGLTLDMVAPRFLESTHIDKTDHPAIMLGSSPERDRDIEDIQKLIRGLLSFLDCRSEIIRSLASADLRRDVLPLWDPFTFAGMPLLSDPGADDL